MRHGQLRSALAVGQWRPKSSGWLAAAVIGVLLVGCGGASSSQPNQLAIEHAGFRLTLPQGWAAEPVNNVEGRLQVVAFLSSAPLDLLCSGTGGTRHCREPESLAEGSLLVTWFAGFCAGNSCVPPTGQPILIGGREASLVTGGATMCADLEPTDDETYFVQVTPQRLDAIVVCKRDAPEPVETALRDMLEHIDWQTP